MTPTEKGTGTNPPGRSRRRSAKDRALLLLSVRSRSRRELERRLVAAGYPPEEIQQALQDLEAVGLVQDDRFAREVVHEHAGRRLAGNRAIRAALRQKGVAADVADRALEEAGDEEARALQLATSRVGRLAGLGPEAAARRLYGLLVRRGFGSGVAGEACRLAIQEAFSGPDVDPDPPFGR